jgi:hypothetical protein
MVLGCLVLGEIDGMVECIGSTSLFLFSVLACFVLGSLKRVVFCLEARDVVAGFSVQILLVLFSGCC